MTHEPSDAADASDAAVEPDPQVEALRRAFRDEPSSGADERPHNEDVVALVEGTLAPERARELASQALDDPELALEIRIASAMRSARDLESTETEASSQADEAANTGNYRRWLFTGALAVAAALLAFFIIRPDTPSFTNEGTPAIRGEPTGALAPTSPSAKLPRDAFILEWTGGPEGATYDLYLTTADLDAVYSAFNLDEVRHTVPEEALAEQSAGTRLLWRVVATSPTGRRTHSSAFEVIVR